MAVLWWFYDGGTTDGGTTDGGTTMVVQPTVGTTDGRTLLTVALRWLLK